MAAFDHSLLPRGDELLHTLMKRKKNWAGKNPGVILVFCIVGTIVILLIGLTVMKKLAARKAAKA
jgi:biotin transporter BioY